MTEEKPTHTPGLEEELEKTGSTRLEEKIQELVEAAEENGTEQTINVEVHYDDSNLTSITIRPEEDYWVEGETGVDKAHIIVGPRAGVKTAEFSNRITEHKTNYGEGTDTLRPWKKIIRKVKRMD